MFTSSYIDTKNLKVQGPGQEVNFNGNVLKGVGTPTDSDHAVNREYIDTVLGDAGVSASVFAENIRLIATSTDTVFLDGVTADGDTMIATNDGILEIDKVTPLKDEFVVISVGTFTGIYTVTSIGGDDSKFELARVALSVSTPNITKNGILALVSDGIINAGSCWKSNQDIYWEQVAWPYPQVGNLMKRVYDETTKLTTFDVRTVDPWTFKNSISMVMKDDPMNTNMRTTTQQHTATIDITAGSTDLYLVKDFEIKIGTSEHYALMFTVRSIFANVSMEYGEDRAKNMGSLQYQFMLNTDTTLRQPLDIIAAYYSGDNETRNPVSLNISCDITTNPGSLWLNIFSENVGNVLDSGMYRCRSNVTYDILDTSKPS